MTFFYFTRWPDIESDKLYQRFGFPRDTEWFKSGKYL